MQLSPITYINICLNILAFFVLFIAINMILYELDDCSFFLM